jgi:hypothetical protein
LLIINYLIFFLGGPSAVACCLRGGWSMGNVNDRYFKYAESGDQYVGRCISLLPVLHVDLAISPPYFSEVSNHEWITDMVQTQFHCLKEIGDFGLLLKMCLASLIFHQQWIADKLVHNHVVRTTSVCLKNAEQLDKMEREKWIIVSSPWSAPHLSFSGIPPRIVRCCKILQKSDRNNVVKILF